MLIEQIAKMTHHTYKTIQNYLNPDYSVVDGHYNVRIPNKLAIFEKFDIPELQTYANSVKKDIGAVKKWNCVCL